MGIILFCVPNSRKAGVIEGICKTAENSRRSRDKNLYAYCCICRLVSFQIHRYGKYDKGTKGIDRACEVEWAVRRNSAEYNLAEYDAWLETNELQLSKATLEYELAKQRITKAEEENEIQLQMQENMAMKLANDSNAIAKMRTDSLLRSAETEMHEAEMVRLAAENKQRKWKKPVDRTLFSSRMDKKTLNALIKAIEKSLPEWRKYFNAKADLGLRNSFIFALTF